MLTFCDLITKLNIFWKNFGCLLLQPCDLEVGAGTFNPYTFLRVLGPEKWYAAYTQLSRRPTDGNYLKKQNKRQQFYQYQVLLKPSPKNMQNVYIESLKYLGIDVNSVDIKFIEDNWESPTLGAHGTGWEVWLNGVEVSQFTYFQKMGGLDCVPIACELTYGVERIAVYIQNTRNVGDIVWCRSLTNIVTYGDIFNQTELDLCFYNFNLANVTMLLSNFLYLETECKRLLLYSNVTAAYEIIIKVSHIFNLLCSRAALSAIEKKNYISRIRKLAICVAKIYFLQREDLYTTYLLRDCND